MVPVYRVSGFLKNLTKVIHSSVRYRQNEVVSPFSLFEARGFTPTLSPSQVSAILHMNEGALMSKSAGQAAVHSFETNQLAANNPIEDRRAVGRLVQTEGLLFGVYDGHGGCACAQALQERLFDYIAVALLPLDILEKFSRSVLTETPLELLQKHKHNNDYACTDMSRMYSASLHKFVSETLSTEDGEPERSFHAALENSFRQLDADIASEALPSSSINFEAVDVALSGACATVAHIAGVHMHVANVGDCRAVLGQFEDGEWHAVSLTEDHNAENEAEVERIKKDHPINEHTAVLKNGRLLGQLAPLRAFGDVRYKWNLRDIQKLEQIGTYGPKISPMNYYTPPYLTAIPEIQYHRLGPRDKFLVLASDGLWEQIPTDKVIQLVAEHMEGRQTLKSFRLKPEVTHKLGDLNQQLKDRKSGIANRAIDTNTATHLIRNALGLDHQKVSSMLTLSHSMARYYRDDITITVVYFDEEYINQHN